MRRQRLRGVRQQHLPTVAGLLAAALATGVFRVSSRSKSAEARRKRRSRRSGAEAEAATSIPPERPK